MTPEERRSTLPRRLLTHADNMQSEGWYTTANILAEAAEEIVQLQKLENQIKKLTATANEIAAARAEIQRLKDVARYGGPLEERR